MVIGAVAVGKWDNMAGSIECNQSMEAATKSSIDSK